MLPSRWRELFVISSPCAFTEGGSFASARLARVSTSAAAASRSEPTSKVASMLTLPSVLLVELM